MLLVAADVPFCCGVPTPSAVCAAHSHHSSASSSSSGAAPRRAAGSSRSPARRPPAATSSEFVFAAAAAAMDLLRLCESFTRQKAAAGACGRGAARASSSAISRLHSARGRPSALRGPRLGFAATSNRHCCVLTLKSLPMPQRARSRASRSSRESCSRHVGRLCCVLARALAARPLTYAADQHARRPAHACCACRSWSRRAPSTPPRRRRWRRCRPAAARPCAS